MFASRSALGFRLWPIAVVCCFAFAGCGGTVRPGNDRGDGGPTGTGEAPGGGGSGGTGGRGGRSTGGTGGRKACPSPLTSCNGSCVDTQNDSNNCGSCASACTSGARCANGNCQFSGGGGSSGCSGGLTYCSNFSRCLDIQTNSFACGTCYTPCANSEACVGGKCLPGTCFPGLTQCSTGCADLGADRNNCGACDNTCGIYESCVGGKCTPPECSAPYVYCPTSGCTDTTSDMSSCGQCGNACAGGPVFDYSAYACTNGKCGCAPLANVCGGGCSTQFWYCPPPGFMGSAQDLCNQTARNAYERCACTKCLAEVTSCETSKSCINEMDCSLPNICVGCGQTFNSCTDTTGNTNPLAEKLIACMNANCASP